MGKVKNAACIISGSPDITVPDNFYFDDKFIYCADSGYDFALNNGIKVDAVFGDFDSVKHIVPINDKFMRFPSQKDDTDTMLCIKDAIKNKFEKMYILGALGGKRFDHAFANIQALNYIFSNGSEGIILDNNNYITMQFHREKYYRKIEGFYFSIFSYTKNSIISLEGFKYEVKDFVISNNFPIGVSNEIINNNAKIELKKGKIIVMYSRKEAND